MGKYAVETVRCNSGTWVFADTEGGRDPYGPAWRCGPDARRKGEVSVPAGDNLYEACADACGWSPAFDADYCKKTFPVPVKLYHESDALLLEYFQTRGVHEGRQASADFGAAACVENCEKALTEALGENYGRCCFCCMPDQDARRGADISNRGGAHPRRLALELPLRQPDEFSMANNYRTEVGAAPLNRIPRRPPSSATGPGATRNTASAPTT